MIIAKRFLFHICVALIIVSCTKDAISVDPVEPTMEIKPELIVEEFTEWNLAPEGTVRLCCGMVDTTAVKDWKIRWYETKDSIVSLIEGAISNYYDVNFDDKGIKNLKCEVTYIRIENDSTEVKEFPFHVAYTGLPALYITTENGQPVENKTDKIPAVLGLSGGGRFEDLNAGLQINGRGTTGWYGTPKKSYNLKLDNKESICGMPKSKKWALRDNHHDRALLRDRYVSYITHQVFNNMGWQPSNINCDFVLNGEYKGCYVLTERISLENGRLTIPDISKVDDISIGGFLCEIDERYDEKFHFRTKHGFNTYSGNTGVAICLKDPDVVTNEVFDYVQTIVQTAEDALFSENFRDPDKGYAYYFDVDALIDWYLVHEFVCMFDAADFYTSAYFFYNPDDRKIYMGPCWDFDTALRSDPHGLNLKKINSWFNRLFEDERFVALVKSRWNEKKHELKESVKVIDEMANIIRISAEYNFMKWPILGTHYDGLDSWEGLKTYQDQVEFMKGWINDRILYMDEDVNL